MKKILLATVTILAFAAPAFAIDARETVGGQAPPKNATSNQCWDVSSNMVRDKNQTNASGTSSGNTSSTVGSTSSKTPMSTGAVGSAGSGSSDSARPAGMPDC